ncbi:prepilin-type N-terminal cleavage/methylation domain-containing protein [Niameybacter massiliensis]|uniref:Prepilin-type N-terminal cleavage/methylation domain-containing protein n=1 Tax=Holtiella tumoricola TaxID=3018743 RepID=A0AA42DRM3_9FIRM|nr:prepilin-type N-terminal cleavage/methylation domain-containing protein [Holtiella tumoricola]MDA3733796.1 prepilin-type N-terminal cleavage/methylation domain-containing protein [Holtiella tumoricola]
MDKDQKGFTLVEVLVSMGIFMLVLIAFGSLLQINLLMNRRSLDIVQNSTNISNDLLEGNTATSSVPSFLIAFSNGKVISVEGYNEKINVETDTVPDLYQNFKTTKVESRP